ncbi:hypothetical protein [Streptomyces xinghaiensis]|uniref:Uncharacterized protein n=2 Tax=Streptomyces TaxID=1883 RepID=A0A3S5ILD5_9ACTN|nr:hypothetical protein [Streptomyces xinghaiensis]PQM24297.1 hypothetical protein Sfr7A_05815 [Streptomyces xinghaiensis]RKM97264.1 hypothetical protein SFRA_008500 [Streptomyces xinghaiensis]
MHEAAEEHVKKFSAVPARRVAEFLRRHGWQQLPGERNKTIWTIRGDQADNLCMVCDGAREGFDIDSDDGDPYCPTHDGPAAALVYPSTSPEGTEAALHTVCAEASMTPAELLNALSLELADEAHLYFSHPLFTFPGDAEEIHGAVGGLMDIMDLCYATDASDETAVHGDVSLTAPDHVTMSFRHHLATEPSEEDDQIRALSRAAAERLQRTLNFLHPAPRLLSVVRQYATGELTLEEVMGPEDFRPGEGPERELWDAVDYFRHQHASFARWRFAYAVQGVD